MPIKCADCLSAIVKLQEEGIFTMTEQRAVAQKIRPLRVLILNLMPTKKVTELQLLRLLGNSPLQLEVDFCRPVTHLSTHTDNSYLDRCYLEFAEIKDKYYDAFIMTGAPVETMAFEEVEYWQELQEYMDWSEYHAYSSLFICWGAQAALYHFYGIQKKLLDAKLFGIFPYGITVKNHPLMRGFGDRYFIPQSRHTAIDDRAVDAWRDLEVVSRSLDEGINICATKDLRRIFILGHFEYDRYTLYNEYVRDKQKGLDIEMPRHYFPDSDSTQQPCFNWCSYAHLFYMNWINTVYQDTPYDLTKLAPAVNEAQLEKAKREYNKLLANLQQLTSAVPAPGKKQ